MCSSDLVPRQYFPKIAPKPTQGQVPQPQLPGWMPPYSPEASTFILPKRPPTKARLPRDADRSRLAKDILKQLGKPSGSVPAVPTRPRYEDRKVSEARIEAASAQPPAKPVVPELQLSNPDGSPLPPGTARVPDQAAPSSSHATYPPETPVGDPPLLEYPDTDPDPAHNYTDATEQDVHMDIEPHEGSSVQPPGLNLPQDSVSSPVAPGSAPATEEGSTVEDRKSVV